MHQWHPQVSPSNKACEICDSPRGVHDSARRHLSKTYLCRIETTGSVVNERHARLRQESEAQTVATSGKAGRKEKERTLWEQGGEEQGEGGGMVWGPVTLHTRARGLEEKGRQPHFVLLGSRLDGAPEIERPRGPLPSRLAPQSQRVGARSRCGFTNGPVGWRPGGAQSQTRSWSGDCDRPILHRWRWAWRALRCWPALVGSRILTLPILGCVGSLTCLLPSPTRGPRLLSRRVTGNEWSQTHAHRHSQGGRPAQRTLGGRPCKHERKMISAAAVGSGPTRLGRPRSRALLCAAGSITDLPYRLSVGRQRLSEDGTRAPASPCNQAVCPSNSSHASKRPVMLLASRCYHQVRPAGSRFSVPDRRL